MEDFIVYMLSDKMLTQINDYVKAEEHDRKEISEVMKSFSEPVNKIENNQIIENEY